MTSELFSSVYKEKSDHLFDDRGFLLSRTGFHPLVNFCPFERKALILAGFCFFIFREQRSTKSHFDAQIGHHFPICSALFATFPSGASSKEHQKVFVYLPQIPQKMIRQNVIFAV